MSVAVNHMGDLNYSDVFYSSHDLMYKYWVFFYYSVMMTRANEIAPRTN